MAPEQLPVPQPPKSELHRWDYELPVETVARQAGIPIPAGAKVTGWTSGQDTNPFHIAVTVVVRKG